MSKELVKVEIERDTLLMLNGLLLENPLLKQEGNNYTLLIKSLIEREKESS